MVKRKSVSLLFLPHHLLLLFRTLFTELSFGDRSSKYRSIVSNQHSKCHLVKTHSKIARMCSTCGTDHV